MDEHGIERKYKHGYSGIDPDKWARAFGRCDKLRKELKQMEKVTISENKVVFSNVACAENVEIDD